MTGSEGGLWVYFERMLQALPQTLWLGATGAVLALAGGALISVVRMRGIAPLRAVALVYVELVRGTPPLVQLFILFFGVTQFGVYLSAPVAGVLWLSLAGAAYGSEIFRAGLSSVPVGQHEAASALSLGRYQTFTKVTIPQAVAQMMPALVTFIVLQIKATTLLYIIGVEEVLFEARAGADLSHRPLAVYGFLALIFIVLNLTVERGLGLMSRRVTAWRVA